MAGANETSPDKRWFIQWVIIKDFGSYFESDTTWEVRVIRLGSGDVHTRFMRGEFANADGQQNSGVKAVHFTHDSSAVIAEYEDGRRETVPLLKS